MEAWDRNADGLVAEKGELFLSVKNTTWRLDCPLVNNGRKDKITKSIFWTMVFSLYKTPSFGGIWFELLWSLDC